MVMRLFFGIKFWQILIAVIATIVAGGWALVKFFETVDRRLDMAKKHT